MADTFQQVVCPKCGSIGFVGDFCEQGCGELMPPAAETKNVVSDDTTAHNVFSSLDFASSSFAPFRGFAASDKDVREFDSLDTKLAAHENVVTAKTALPEARCGAQIPNFGFPPTSSVKAGDGETDESPIEVIVTFPKAFVKGYRSPITFEVRSKGGVFNNVRLSVNDGEKDVASVKAPSSVDFRWIHMVSNITPASQGKVALQIALVCNRVGLAKAEKYLSRTIDVTIYPGAGEAVREITINSTINADIDASGEKAGGGLSGGVNISSPLGNLGSVFQSQDEEKVIARLGNAAPRAVSFFVVEALNSLTLSMPDGNSLVHIFSSEKLLFGRHRSCDVILRVFNNDCIVDRKKSCEISKTQFVISNSLDGKMRIIDGGPMRDDNGAIIGSNVASTFGTAVNDKCLPQGVYMPLLCDSHYTLNLSPEKGDDGVMKLEVDTYRGLRNEVVAAHICRTDAIPESYLAIWGAFDLGKIASVLSGYVVHNHDGKFLLQTPEGEYSALLPEREFGPESGRIYVRSFQQTYL